MDYWHPPEYATVSVSDNVKIILYIQQFFLQLFKNVVPSYRNYQRKEQQNTSQCPKCQNT